MDWSRAPTTAAATALLVVVLWLCLDITSKIFTLSYRTFEHLYEVLNIGLKKQLIA